MKQQIGATILDSLHENSDKRDGAQDLEEELPEQVPDGIHGPVVMQQHRAKKGDIRLHFDILCLMCENLASMGHSPSEDDFYAIVIGSLPPSYDPSALNSTSSVLGTFLSPNNLMQTVTSEYDR